jgi:hypothetical protein
MEGDSRGLFQVTAITTWRNRKITKTSAICNSAENRTAYLPNGVTAMPTCPVSGLGVRYVSSLLCEQCCPTSYLLDLFSSRSSHNQRQRPRKPRSVTNTFKATEHREQLWELCFNYWRSWNAPRCKFWMLSLSSWTCKGAMPTVTATYTTKNELTYQHTLSDNNGMVFTRTSTHSHTLFLHDLF